MLVHLLLYTFTFIFAESLVCVPPYQNCPNGACSIFSDYCNLCKNNQLVCPDSTTCVNDYNNCPLLPFQNQSLSLSDRLSNLLSLLRLDEKVGQLVVPTPAIQRLGIPYYEWSHESLHGVAREDGPATSFPQVIGLGATFDMDLINRIGRAISDEARAKYIKAVSSGNLESGITFYAPNINIYRDPRWGRGHETPGEDPYLTSMYAVAYVKGLQEGPDPAYVQTAACCKHYAVYNFDNLTAQNLDRHSFNAVVSQRDLLETYLPAFKACVSEGKGQTIMCSYNAVNGVPVCASKTLLVDYARTQWGFDGFVMSDEGAIDDILNGHHYVASGADAALMAVSAGCDQELPIPGQHYFSTLVDSVNSGKVPLEVVDDAVRNIFRVRIRLGLLDNPFNVSYNYIPYSVVVSPENTQLALEAARKSIVLLKNTDKVLPLPKNITTIAVIGPNANETDILLGNYAGNPSNIVSILDGIKSKATGKVLYQPGCAEQWCTNMLLFPDAVNAAKSADVIILVMGIRSCPYDSQCWVGRAEIEGEQKDRVTLDLPGYQEDLIKLITSTSGSKPVIVVLVHGGSVTVKFLPSVHGLLSVFYPGEQGGNAVADVLFGDYNPGGKLSTTWVNSLSDLPPVTDVSMKGRTYRFFEGTPMYPFGYGLSYTNFTYTKLRLSSTSITPCTPIVLEVTVTNTGDSTGDEVVQVYFSLNNRTVPTPQLQLVAFTRVSGLKSLQSSHLRFTIGYDQMTQVTDDGVIVIEPGTISVSVGGGQPKVTDGVLEAVFAVTGAITPVDQCK